VRALPLLLCLALVLAACGGPRPLELEPADRAPAVYRVTAEATSEFSGAVSDLRSSTEFTAVFRSDPAPESGAEVEVIYAAASVQNANGEMVALDLGSLRGKRATVEFRSPGVPSGISGDEELLEAGIPLISTREIIMSLFPALPGEALVRDDAWVADSPVPFSNISGPPARLRYVLTGVDRSASSGRVEGYAVASGRNFVAEPVGERVSGTGELYIYFDGEYEAGTGYTRTEREAEFDTNYIRLGSGGSDFANGSVHMEYYSTVERLSPVEQFGLDAGGEIPD
jgi:predicted small lipoprotein YifL